jgi:OmpA-like transmembrane domain
VIGRGIAKVLTATVILFGSILGADEAVATDLVPVDTSPLSSIGRYYLGASISGIHHTGYVPGTVWSAEGYTAGAKAFVGYRWFKSVQFELAYHYLGQISFDEHLPVESQERSYAVAGSILYVSPPLSEWLMPTLVPVYVLLRAGLAYKNITHISARGNADEGILSGVLGFMLEYRLTPNMFARLEYEFLSTAIGGPSQGVASNFGGPPLTFGGTHRVINAMHTPLSVTLGFDF